MKRSKINRLLHECLSYLFDNAVPHDLKSTTQYSTSGLVKESALMKHLNLKNTRELIMIIDPWVGSKILQINRVSEPEIAITPSGIDLFLNEKYLNDNRNISLKQLKIILNVVQGVLTIALTAAVVYLQWLSMYKN